jgi:hypothetical protein
LSNTNSSSPALSRAVSTEIIRERSVSSVGFKQEGSVTYFFQKRRRKITYKFMNQQKSQKKKEK